METIVVAPGDALARLVDVVQAAKNGDPLAPVTVVVPTNAAGVTARRYLGRHGGVAAVDMVTLARIAEVIGGPSLVAAGRRPVSTPVIDLAVRAVLDSTPGPFATVADHPSTVVALRDLHRELRAAGSDALDRLASSSTRGRDAAQISLSVTRRLEAGWYDEGDLFVAAIEQCADGLPAPQLERVVLFLPHPMRGLDLAFVRALAARASVQAVLPVVGDPAADAEMQAMARAFDAPFEFDADPPVTAPDRVVSTTDADEEVRFAVRSIVDAARCGTPFARIALLWPTDQPYARLVEHHLAIADIPWNGRPGTGVAERIVPRFLLDLLDVDRRGLRRRDLFDLLADLPVRDETGRHVPVARWERISRAAGVSRDDDWVPRLRAYATRQRERDARLGRDESPRADDADALVEYVASLRRSLGHRGATRRWDAWVAWSEQQIQQRLGHALLTSLSEPERVAFEHANRVLDRLRSLDAIGPPVTRSQFRAVFAAEFEVAPGRLGRIGRGVTVGSLSGAVGLDVDLVIILGATDGSMPPAPNSGPLVGDGDRAAAGLAPSDAVGLRMHRQFRSALAAAGTSIVTFPRGDLRATAQRIPTRWLAAIDAPAVEPVSSHHAALLGTEFPTNDGEYRLRGLLAASVDAGPLDPTSERVAADLVAARSLFVRAARRSSTFTEFDGDLTGEVIGHFDRPLAPTQVEQWVTCPHGYFMRHILGVYPVEEPGDQMEIDPAERGNLVHITLDRFHHEVIGGTLPQPSPGWTDTHWQRLTELFDETATEFELSGRTGRSASWHVQRAAVLSDLRRWFERDSDRLTATGATIVSSEAFFGDDGSVTLPLGDGRSVSVRGQIDRIDRTRDGTLVVTDHKTGSIRHYRDIGPDEPTAGGSRYQLPAYAAGALALTGDDAPVRAEYSFFAKGQYKRIGYAFDEAVWERVRSDLADVVEGIESGLYPARPAVPGFQLWVDCHYCQPDALGTAERYPEWVRKRNDPRGARWFAEPTDHDGDGDEGGAA